MVWSFFKVNFLLGAANTAVLKSIRIPKDKPNLCGPILVRYFRTELKHKTPPPEVTNGLKHLADSSQEGRQFTMEM